MSDHGVTSAEQLRAIYPPPKQRSLDKEIDHLDDHCRRFISMSPFVVVSSAGADGACEASPKGGPPGFVRVLDERRLLIPNATGIARRTAIRPYCDRNVRTAAGIPAAGRALTDAASKPL